MGTSQTNGQPCPDLPTNTTTPVQPTEPSSPVLPANWGMITDPMTGERVRFDGPVLPAKPSTLSSQINQPSQPANPAADGVKPHLSASPDHTFLPHGLAKHLHDTAYSGDWATQTYERMTEWTIRVVRPDVRLLVVVSTFSTDMPVEGGQPGESAKPAPLQPTEHPVAEV